MRLKEMMEYGDMKSLQSLDKNVCSNCFYDKEIICYIEKNGTYESCSYCKPKYQSEKAIGFDELMEFLCRGIYHFYDDAANAGLTFETGEGGYQGKHFSSFELIYEEIGLGAASDKLLTDIIRTLPQFARCKKDPFTLDKNKELIYDWKRFADLLKHSVRYSFFRTRQFDTPDRMAPSDILREIALSVDKLDLIKTIKKGDAIFRSRQHAVSETPGTIYDLGAPDLKYCLYSNRMSPAGIPMFYGAFDAVTAEAEVIDLSSIKTKPNLTTGKFILEKDLQVINLCSLPETPGMFDDERRSLRYTTLFLKEFVCEISKEIKRDGHEHIEYVPTQVVTEYFRFVLPEIAHFDINGIIYPSAKKEGERNCVLFFDNKGCRSIFSLAPDNVKTRII